MKISVVMTSYNYAEYLPDAIESVINQTYKDWELIIVDDGSTDNSVEIIKEYSKKDPRIKLFQHEEGVNKGLADTVKLGCEKASGDWIVFLESDDKFTPDSLEMKCRAIEENPNIDLVFTDLTLIGEKNPNIDKYFQNREENFLKKDSSTFVSDFPQILPKLNIIPTFSVVMVKKELLLNCDFNCPCKSSLDAYLWAQLSDKNIYYLNEKLSYWRIHDNSYLNRDKTNWFTKYYFNIKIYYFTIRGKNLLLKTLLLLNYMRARLIYLKCDKKSIKLNLLNDVIIFEKLF